MKAEKIFTIGSLIAFFALLPALIILEIRVLEAMPEISYLFIIMDILLVGFIVLEIVLITRKWKREKDKPQEIEEPTGETQIEQAWGEDDSTNSNEGKDK